MSLRKQKKNRTWYLCIIIYSHSPSELPYYLISLQGQITNAADINQPTSRQADGKRARRMRGGISDESVCLLS